MRGGEQRIMLQNGFIRGRIVHEANSKKASKESVVITSHNSDDLFSPNWRLITELPKKIRAATASAFLWNFMALIRVMFLRLQVSDLLARLLS